MESYDLVVVGGGPGGSAAAFTCRRLHQNASILVIRSKIDTPIPCGLPYIFGFLDGNPQKDAAPFNAKYQMLNIDFMLGTAESVNTEDHTVSVATAEGTKVVQYRNVILSTGSVPTCPPIPGLVGDRSFTISKDLDVMAELVAALPAAASVVIIGAGFIGVEVAEQIAHAGKTVHLVEALDCPLGAVFSGKLCDKATAILADKMTLHMGCTVKSIQRDAAGAPAAVIVSNKDGEDVTIDTNTVVCATGMRPSTQMFQDTSVPLNCHGFITVDKHGRVEGLNNVFAVGDCAQCNCALTQATTPVMLASIACAQGRVVGENVLTPDWPDLPHREFPGSLSAVCTAIEGVYFARAGVSAPGAAAAVGQENVFFTEHAVPNRHPGCLPGAQESYLNVLWDIRSGRMLGAQMYGGPETGEIINWCAEVIRTHGTAATVASFPLATHPMLQSSPLAHPMVMCAEMADVRVRKTRMASN